MNEKEVEAFKNRIRNYNFHIEQIELINDEMNIAAAYAIADLVGAEELAADSIMPDAVDERVAPAVAEAVAEAARKSGVARI